MTAITKEVGVEVTLLQPWLASFAYWVSHVGSPPLTGAGAAITVGLMVATALAWQWTLLYLA